MAGSVFPRAAATPLVLVVAGCLGVLGVVVADRVLTTGSDGRVRAGTPDNCFGRDAYCPVHGPGVSRPEQPAVSPSGRYRLDVLPVRHETAAEDWTFRVIDTSSGITVLRAGGVTIDGGVGSTIAWGPGLPDTVWAVGGSRVMRWRHDRAAGTWSAGVVARDEPLPEVVRSAATARIEAD